MLARLLTLCRTHPQMWTTEDAQVMFQSLPRTKMAKKSEGIMPNKSLFMLKLRLRQFILECGRQWRPTVRWSHNKVTSVFSNEDRKYDFPQPLAEPLEKPRLTRMLKHFLALLAGGNRPSPAVEQ